MAIAGLAKIDATVKVIAGKVSVVRIAMNMGALEIKTLAAEGSQKPAPAWHQMTPLAPVEAEKARPLRSAFGASYRVQLPAGNYVSNRSTAPRARKGWSTVAAGQDDVEDGDLERRRGEGQPPAGKADKVCAVYEAGADRKRSRSGAPRARTCDFFLKAGRYQVECRKKGDAAPRKQAEISVVAGEVQSAKIED